MLARISVFLLLSTAAVAMQAAAPAAASPYIYYGSERSATKEGFSFPESEQVTIVIMRPDIFVGAQSTGGMDRINAEWTGFGRDNLISATRKYLQHGGFQASAMLELSGDDANIAAEYRALFKTVTNAAIQNSLWPVDGLPTKKQGFNWTLGPSISHLAELGGGNYGLFLYSYDSYSLPGRKALEIIGFAKGLEAVSQPHIGYAGLVDLKTGELVWMNVNVRIGGDVRRPEGADDRVSQLLNNFPQRGVAASEHRGK
ncbi:MAG: hypothetical protein V3V15_07865 [Sphingorhabdus sp.]